MDGTGGHLAGALPGEEVRSGLADAPGKAEFLGRGTTVPTTSPFIKGMSTTGTTPRLPLGLGGLSFGSLSPGSWRQEGAEGILAWAKASLGPVNVRKEGQ